MAYLQKANEGRVVTFNATSRPRRRSRSAEPPEQQAQLCFRLNVDELSFAQRAREASDLRHRGRVGRCVAEQIRDGPCGRSAQ